MEIREKRKVFTLRPPARKRKAIRFWAIIGDFWGREPRLKRNQRFSKFECFGWFLCIISLCLSYIQHIDNFRCFEPFLQLYDHFEIWMCLGPNWQYKLKPCHKKNLLLWAFFVTLFGLKETFKWNPLSQYSSTHSSSSPGWEHICFKVIFRNLPDFLSQTHQKFMSMNKGWF